MLALGLGDEQTLWCREVGEVNGLEAGGGLAADWRATEPEGAAQRVGVRCGARRKITAQVQLLNVQLCHCRVVPYAMGLTCQPHKYTTAPR